MAPTTADETQLSDGHRGVSRGCGRESCMRRVCTCGFVTGIGWMDLVLLQTRLLMIHIGQMAIGVAVVGAAAQVASATCALQTESLCGGSSIGFSTRVLSRAPFAPAVGAAAVAASLLFFALVTTPAGSGTPRCGATANRRGSRQKIARSVVCRQSHHSMGT